MLKLGSLELVVDSVGGLGTCVQVPAWRLAFDLGRGPLGSERGRSVLFSHAHIDHMVGVVPHCATRDLMGMAPPTYWIPAASVPAFEDMLDAWRRLDGSALPCEVHGVEPGDRIDLGRGRRAEVFATHHRIHSVGYAVVETRERLREDLRGLPGTELRDRRERGESISQAIDKVVLAYTGDSTIEVVEEQPMVRRAEVLVMEITFLDQRVPASAAQRLGHIHLDDVIARAELFDNEHVVAIHLSARYGMGEAREILRRRLPEALRERVVLAGRAESRA